MPLAKLYLALDKLRSFRRRAADGSREAEWRIAVLNGRARGLMAVLLGEARPGPYGPH